MVDFLSMIFFEVDIILLSIILLLVADVLLLAVVDPLLRVHGIDRLRIADALVFPNITSANLNAPTTMLAHKAAQLILAAHIG